MNDLISRQAAIKALCEKGMCGDKQCNAYPCEDVRAIEQVPTIDPAENGGCLGCQYEKLGQWRMKELDKFRKYEVVCSECGAKYIGNYDAYDEPCEFNYCPNCGARMDIE